METAAYFKNIHEQLLKELEQAAFSITAAIAWFTDSEIFELLCKKAANDTHVRILLTDDGINRGKHGLDFSKLEALSGEIYFIPSQTLMHNKFCVIDDTTLITGSYNWSKKARSNYENMIVINGDYERVQQFMDYYESILSDHGFSGSKKEPKYDAAKIITRLELIHNLMRLDEISDIQKHLDKLKPFVADTDIAHIITLVNEGDTQGFAKAITLYKGKKQAITEYGAIDKEYRKLELKTLEIELNAISDEKAEIERRVASFNRCHDLILGNLLMTYFRLRKEKFKRERDTSTDAEQEYTEAKQEYQDYKEEYDTSKSQPDVPPLSKQKQETLKNIYRRTSKLCHPDKVAEEYKEQAHKVFVELQKYYKSNDIDGVERIRKRLCEGGIFKIKSEATTEPEAIKKAVIDLRYHVETILHQIDILTKSKAWQVIESTTDLESYFEEQKEAISSAINNLRMELENE